MFAKQFGDVTLKMVTAPKRGTCLEASKSDGTKIYMDIIGSNPMLVPDGTNAYFFGNKLIFVTRWAEMNDNEKRTVKNDEVIVAIHPYKCPMFNIKIGANWGDVMLTLPHCWSQLNDVTQPIDGIIFTFGDTHDSDFFVCRYTRVPAGLQAWFKSLLPIMHTETSIDDRIPELCQKAENDRSRDLYDYIYDEVYEKSGDYQRAIRGCDPERIENGIYLKVDSDGAPIALTQGYLPAEKWADTSEREAPPISETASEPMSSEVKLYSELAEKGFAEGQYNLGYCYEYGDGVAKNPEKAVYWYKKAAESGYAKAKYNLGVCLYNGFGTAEDKSAAAELFLEAANDGDMYAQYNIGICYFRGDGVENDTTKALTWIMKAAEQGHPEAKKLFGGA